MSNLQITHGDLLPSSLRHTLGSTGCGLNSTLGALSMLADGKARVFIVSLLLALCSLEPGLAVASASQCFGTASKGRLDAGVKLPIRGENFAAYSAVGAAAGRTHVHSTVADIIVGSYAALATAMPSKTFVYGETGWAGGGRFRPHRTHQNGLSVDFFVPVKDSAGKSVPIPTDVMSRFGYDVEFDANARYAGYVIDFPAMAEHLYQLDQAAKARGKTIALVIFDPVFLPHLFATERGVYLRKNLPFMKGRPWVRHDEHYHINFAIACERLPR